MKLKNINVKNFRLLNEVELSLEDNTTVIVGRNNSGKTSITELFEYLLSSAKPKFSLEDFTLSVHESFWDAFVLHEQKSDESSIREKLPLIEVILTFNYDKDILELGPLSDLVIDLSPDSTTAIVKISYQLGNGKIETFFEGIPDSTKDVDIRKKTFFKIMRDKIPQLYTTILTAIDPTDDQHTKDIELSSLKTILMSGFIRAQRKLDDVSDRDINVLGKILENILSTAKSETATPEDKNVTQKLEESVQEAQNQMNSGFNTQLD
jgi:putative ATP-dependent endonuclease of OLD family